jgi:hypothetical protein
MIYLYSCIVLIFYLYWILDNGMLMIIEKLGLKIKEILWYSIASESLFLFVLGN